MKVNLAERVGSFSLPLVLYNLSVFMTQGYLLTITSCNSAKLVSSSIGPITPMIFDLFSGKRQEIFQVPRELTLSRSSRILFSTFLIVRINKPLEIFVRVLMIPTLLNGENLLFILFNC